MNSDPPRLLDGGGVPPEVRELLAAAPRVPPLTDAVRAQSAAHVARLAASAGGVWFLGRYWSRGGLLGGTGAAGAAGALLVALAVTHPWAPRASASHGAPATAPARVAAPVAQPPAPAPAPAAPPAATTPAPDLVVETPETAPPARETARARAHAPRGPIAAPTPEQEHAVLEQARAALTRGEPRAALAHVREHAQLFPRGQLNEEREYVTIRALAALGRRAQARARGEAFVARYPQGTYTDDVRRLLARLP